MTILKLRTGVFVALAVVLQLCCAGRGHAQSGQADAQGIITDPAGALVAGAQVVLTNVDSGDKRTVKTGSDGRYTFPSIAPGHYSIMVSAASFSPETINGLTVMLDNHVNQDVTLKLGSANDVVEVTSAVPAVDTTAYDVGGIVDQAQIDNLPIPNRQYLALALLTPGTTQDASRSFYSNVQSGGGIYFYANGFSWDGVSNQQTEEGDPRQNIPEDAVGEFKTYTAQMPADLGWAMGGYTALVTKGGTNHIHGDVFEYYRDQQMTADNQFTQASELNNHTGSPLYSRNQFGGSIGGPILKDRTHYFGSYERTQGTTSYTLFGVGATAQGDYSSLLGTFATPNHDQLIVARVDHQLKPNQQLFFRVGLESQLATAQGCGNTNTTGCYDGQFPRRAYVAGHTWEPNGRMVNEARFQYAYISYELGPYGTTPPKKPTDLLTPSYSKNITLAYSFPSFSYGQNYAADGVESRWQVNDTLSVQKGAHSIKLGFDVSYVPYVDAVASNLNGTYFFRTDQAFDGTPASTAALCPTPTSTSCPYQFTQSAVPLLYYLPSTQHAYFLEDSWKAKPNLTLSAGIRYDLQKGSPFLDTYTPNPAKPAIPYEGNPHTRGDYNNFGPRVGFSYDPFKKSKDVIRGGYGVFYNFVQTELSEGEKLNFVACSIQITAPTGSYVPYPNPYGTGTAASFCGATANTNVVILSPGLSNPYLHQFSLGYTRQLGSDLSVSVDGIYDRGLRDYKVYDRNLAPAVGAPRPDPQIAQIQQHASTAATEYKALYLKFTKRYSHRYMYTASYALSSAHDNNPHAAPVDYNNQGNDWGPANIDRRDVLVLSGSVMLPWKIMVGGIFSFRTREPFSVTTTITSPNGTTLTANPNPNLPAQYVPGTKRNQGNRDINYAAINAYRADLDAHVSTYSGLNATGGKIAGTTGCAVNGPGVGNCLSTNLSAASVVSNQYEDFDLRLSKTIFQREAMKLEVIGQAFNLFGTENYTGITTSPTLNTFGQPTGAGNVQIGELAAKFTF